jgi:3-vinyl bacteriochlorophyllide hydratase
MRHPRLLAVNRQSRPGLLSSNRSTDPHTTVAACLPTRQVRVNPAPPWQISVTLRQVPLTYVIVTSRFSAMGSQQASRAKRLSGQAPGAGLYSVAERRRRDASPWTWVQGVLAPIQFLVFLVSLGLVLRYLATGEGESIATLSIVVKTLTLYTIMVTGCIWEKQVFGVWLFAPAFYWEDMFSMAVLALHTAYLIALASGALGPRALMLLALAAYATYVINATQFVLKLRAARLQQARLDRGAAGQEVAA